MSMVVTLTIGATAGSDGCYAAHRYYGGHDHKTLVASLAMVASVATMAIHSHRGQCDKAIRGSR